MKKNTFVIISAVLILILASLACSAPIDLGPLTAGNTQQAPTSDTQSAPSSPTKASVNPQQSTTEATKAAPNATSKPSSTSTPKGPSPEVLPMRQALNSFNTYRMQVKVINNGPTANDRDESKYLYESNSQKKNSHTRSESVSSSASDPVVDTSISDSYQVGNKTCSLSDGKTEGKLKDTNPLEDDINNTMAALADMVMTSENPTYVAEETVNGIATYHFTFKATKLGKDSGGTVTKNSGDYWVAKDGKYLVKYAVVLELTNNTQDKTKAQTYHSEIAIDLLSVNQALEITMPAGCKP